MSFPQFHIKICGITSVADAELCTACGADALGLNFYPPSPRYLKPDQAAAIANAVSPDVVKVGLFVNATVDEIRSAIQHCELDVVQLHGDEPPEFLAELSGIPLMRALRCGPDLTPVLEYLDRCHEINASPGAILLDAYHPKQYGGTGMVADWNAIAAHRARWSGYHLVLAGGLTPLNVAQAIEAVGPAAVDTASGVESAPGRKSKDLVQGFTTAAAQAFASRKRQG